MKRRDNTMTVLVKLDGSPINLNIWRQTKMPNVRINRFNPNNSVQWTQILICCQTKILIIANGINIMFQQILKQLLFIPKLLQNVWNLQGQILWHYNSSLCNPSNTPDGISWETFILFKILPNKITDLY